MEKYIDTRNLLNNTYQPVYDKVFSILRGFNRRFEFDSDGEYLDMLHIIGNHVYLIYERLYLNIVREIDYTVIKNFAINNNSFVKGIFKRDFPEFSIDSLNGWTRTGFHLFPGSLYSRNNKYNKNIYH